MQVLEAQAAKAIYNLIVYVFIPDHMHVLIEGRDDSFDVYRAIVGFKQQSGFWLGQHFSQFHWQKDFYDHALRTWERGASEIKKHVDYILNNPVRKEIVQLWKGYPYRGSTVNDLDLWE
jgi:putative transposase